LQLVFDADPFEAWRLTLEANTRALDGNRALAEDLLMTLPEARDLYRRAISSATQKEAKRRNVVSVSPSEVGL
jgi:hypothetical protein